MTCENYTNFSFTVHNKILLEHSQEHLFLYWPWLFSHCKLNSCLWLQSLKYLLSGPGQKMFIYTCVKHQKRSGFQRSLLFSGVISRSYFAYKNCRGVLSRQALSTVGLLGFDFAFACLFVFFCLSFLAFINERKLDFSPKPAVQWTAMIYF